MAKIFEFPKSDQKLQKEFDDLLISIGRTTSDMTDVSGGAFVLFINALLEILEKDGYGVCVEHSGNKFVVYREDVDENVARVGISWEGWEDSIKDMQPGQKVILDLSEVRYD